MIEYDGKVYERDGRGKYRCPNDVCSQWNPEWPRPSWSSDKGFLKHLAECASKVWTPKPVTEQEKFADCPDCGTTIWKMSSYWEMTGGAFVCLACYLPYYEQGRGFIAPAGLELSIFSLEV